MPFCPEGKTAVSSCVKYTVMFGALLHLLCAMVLIAVGAWAFQEKNKFSTTEIKDVYDIFFNLSIVMMIVGSIMFIITVCGFVGALRENVCLLKFFYIALLIIFLLEMVGGILVIVFKDKVIEIFSDVLKEVYVEEYEDDTDGIMDHFQEKYHCCGVNGYLDWNENAYYNCTPGNPSRIKCSVPYSCCKDPDEFTPNLVNILCGATTLASNTTSLEKIWTTGCVETLVQVAEKNLPLIAGVLIAIAIPQLMGIFLGKRLAEQITYQWKVYRRSRAGDGFGYRGRY